MRKSENPIEPFKRAVTSAVRAIARDPDLEVTFGGDGTTPGITPGKLPIPSRELITSEVANVRGAGDAYALWRRYHDNGTHARYQPAGAVAKAVFESVEQARVESIGANRMQNQR